MGMRDDIKAAVTNQINSTIDLMGKAAALSATLASTIASIPDAPEMVSALSVLKTEVDALPSINLPALAALQNDLEIWTEATNQPN